MEKGTVKFFNHEKGFGFITPENGNDIFVHISEVITGADLNDGDKVEYSIGEGKKGPCATGVRPIN